MLKGLLKYKHYILLALSLCLLAVLVVSIDVDVFIGNLRKIEPWTIGFWLVVYAASWVLRALRLWLITGRRVTPFTSFRLQITAFALNLMYPAKLGDFMIASFLKKYIGGRYQISVAFMLQLRLLDLMTLGTMTVLSLLLVPPERIPGEIGLLFWVLIAGGLFSFFMLIWLQTSSWLRSLQRYLPEKILRVKPFIVHLISMHDFNRVYVLSIITSIGIWLLEAVTIYVISQQFHPQTEFVPLLLAMSVGNLLKVFPLFPGGLGTYEAGFVLMLTLYGVPVEVSVTLAIVDHLLKKFVNLLVGFPSYLLWHRRNPEATGAGDWSQLKP